MDTYTIAFFGHRYIDNPFPIEDALERLIVDVLHEKQYVVFLVGRDGEFDQIVSSTVLRTRRNHREDNSSLTLVMPYLKAEFKNNEENFYEYYDDIEVCEESSITHFKGAIQVRNRSMVDRADLVVFYVEHEHGGAYQTMKYALNNGKRVINLAAIGSS